MKFPRILTLLLAGFVLAFPATALHLGKNLPQWQADLNSGNRTVRLLAARAIGEMAIAREPGAAAAVFAALDHDDSAVRYWAVVAAAQMGEAARPAEKKLQSLLDDPAPEVRIGSAFALAKLGRVDEGVEALIREMGNPDKGARLYAVDALDNLGEQARAAVPVLRRAVTDEFDYVQRIARHALWVLGERPCPYKKCEGGSQ